MQRPSLLSRSVRRNGEERRRRLPFSPSAVKMNKGGATLVEKILMSSLACWHDVGGQTSEAQLWDGILAKPTARKGIIPIFSSKSGSRESKARPAMPSNRKQHSSKARAEISTACWASKQRRGEISKPGGPQMQLQKGQRLPAEIGAAHSN